MIRGGNARIAVFACGGGVGDLTVSLDALGYQVRHLDVVRGEAAPELADIDLLVVDISSANGDVDSPALSLAELGRESALPVVVVARTSEIATLRAVLARGLFLHILGLDAGGHVDARWLRVTVAKALGAELWGFEPYLSPRRVVETHRATALCERDSLADAASAFASSRQGSGRIARRLALAVDELFTNAIGRAPSPPGSAGTVDVVLGCDEGAFCVAVRDGFGSLGADDVLRALSCSAATGRPRGDHPSGGAGLGLYYLLVNTDALVINVAAARCTEVIGFMRARPQASSSPRSLSVSTFAAAPR